jgi:LacI family transcriptional regulator
MGYNLMLFTTVAEEEGATAVKKVDRRIDGLVLVAPPLNSPIHEECKRRNLASISITDCAESVPLTVNSEDYEGGRLATQHLLDLGHRRIAHLYGNPSFATTQPRLQAYRDTLDSAGIDLDSSLIEPGGFSRPMGQRSMEKLLRLPADARPTAVFAANDLSAHGAIDAIGAAGLRVPDDISVVGYDDTWYASVTVPPLTSVCMNVASLGRCAAETLIAHLEGQSPDRHPTLPVSLTVRQSTGPVQVLHSIPSIDISGEI